MKTEPLAHQRIGTQILSTHLNYYALGADQGTGKTWMSLRDMEDQFERGLITGALVFAPTGVHYNWVLKEIPEHMSTPHVAVAWRSGAGKRESARIAAVLNTPPEKLAILCVNYEGLRSAACKDLVWKFVRRFTTACYLDESHWIKNPASAVNKTLLKIGGSVASKRLLSGTLVADKPLDLFGQCEFLAPGLLGTRSYRAFVARYARLLPDNHPIVVKAAAKTRGNVKPQIIQRDATGAPIYRNVEELRERLSMFCWRVLKSECLDLPDKVYQTHYFDLEKAQRKVYDELKEDARYQHPDGEIETFEKLALQTKLQQVTSGFIMRDGEATSLPASSARLKAMRQLLGELDGQAIIWARYVEELRLLGELAEELGLSHALYFGETSKADRLEAIRAFQAGELRLFIANQQTAARGLTLTAASTVYYFSNSFAREPRVQSEDRAHRIGTKRPVLYVDLVARDTIDERIVQTLTAKNAIADYVMDINDL